MRPSWRDARKVQCSMKENTKFDNKRLVAAWFRKLPWLEGHFNQKEIKKMTAHLFDGAVIRRTCGYHCQDKILLFQKNGELIGRVGQELVAEEVIPRYISFGTFKWCFWKQVILSHDSFFEETVETAIRRYKAEETTAFIVGEFDGEADSEGFPMKRLVISRLPEGHSLDSWISKLGGDEKKKMEEAGQEIDRILQSLGS